LYFVLLKQPFVKRKPVKTGKKKIPERSRSVLGRFYCISLTSALDGVGGQRHAPAALPPGKDPVPIA